MLAPMTNTQSFENGHLSDDEYKWLTMRSPEKLTGDVPLCPSENEAFGARAMTMDDVRQLRDDFIAGAVRAKTAGYDGSEVHGAHGYIVNQFLSSDVNKRTDDYGVSLENRSRLLFEIVGGIREMCGSDFLLGVRISPEGTGLEINEAQIVCQELIDKGNTDFLDISLWDSFKLPENPKYRHKTLLDHFTDLDFKDVKYTVAEKNGPVLMSGKYSMRALTSQPSGDRAYCITISRPESLRIRISCRSNSRYQDSI